MLPNITCGDQPESICCETIWNAANHILSQVAPGLMECIRGCTCCEGQFYAYVSQSEPEVLHSNYLAIWLANLAPSIRSNSPTVTTFTQANLMRATWIMKISESGYPKLDADLNEAVSVPGFDELHYMNRYVYSHGEQMFRLLMKAANEKTLTPQGDTTFTLLAFGPTRPQAGSTGYTVQFTTDLHWQT